MTKKLKKASHGSAVITSFFISKSPKEEIEILDDEVVEIPGAQKAEVLDIASSEDEAVIEDAAGSDSDYEDGSQLRRSKRLRKTVNYKETKEEHAPSPKVARRENGSVGLQKKKLFPLFVPKGAASSQDIEIASKPVPKVVDFEVLEFLKSGINSTTRKAQQLNAARREKEDSEKSLQLFPTLTHVGSSSSLPVFHSTCAWKSSLGFRLIELDEDRGNEYGNQKIDELFQCTRAVPEDSKPSVICCSTLAETRNQSSASPAASPHIKGLSDETSSKENNLPWVLKYGGMSKSQLAVDDEAVKKMYEWLKRWKKSISSDGGKSRQYMEKKRRNSDSDTDEDDEMEAKALVLIGPTGCGKTATVMALAQKLNFKVVEVNFSIVRSGKEVLKRVEEATLSNRLQAGQDCLLLFEDISLVDPKDDEGFVAAVSQLITASCRPIVMTQTTLYDAASVGSTVAGECDTLSLDLRLLKKEPLYVHLSAPEPMKVLEKAIMPILKDSIPAKAMTNELKARVEAVIRHFSGDIRRSINEIQFLIMKCGSTVKFLESFHYHISPTIDQWYLLCDYTPKSDTSRADAKKAHASKWSLATVQRQLEVLKETLDVMGTYDTVVTWVDMRQHNFDLFDDDIRTGRAERLLQGFSDVVSKVECAANKQVFSEQSIAYFRPALLLFENDKLLQEDIRSQSIFSEAETYFTPGYWLGGCGLSYFEEVTFLRTMVKYSALSLVGSRSRSSRKNYCSWLGPHQIEQMSDTFGFKREEELFRASKL